MLADANQSLFYSESETIADGNAMVVSTMIVIFAT